MEAQINTNPRWVPHPSRAFVFAARVEKHEILFVCGSITTNCEQHLLQLDIEAPRIGSNFRNPGRAFLPQRR